MDETNPKIFKRSNVKNKEKIRYINNPPISKYISIFNNKNYQNQKHNSKQLYKGFEWSSQNSNNMQVILDG